MIISFLVGNGFDISAGIKTSYSDFYKWYQDQDSPSKAERNLKSELKKYTESGDEGKKWSHWADFEEGLGRHTKEFLKEQAESFKEDVFAQAKGKLIEYLKQECDKYSFEVSQKALELFRNGLFSSKNLSYFYSELNDEKAKQGLEKKIRNDRANDTEIRFASFNYTFSLDRIISRISEEPLDTWFVDGTPHKMTVKQDVLHVHGTINGNPILGVSDEKQIIGEALRANKTIRETLVKPVAVKTVHSQNYDKLEKWIGESDIICIWGLSLGKTDAHWWKQIMYWLREKGDRRLIVFWHAKEDPDNIRNGFANSQRTIISAFKNYLEVSGNKDIAMQQLQKRIHVVTNTKKVLHISFSEK